VQFANASAFRAQEGSASFDARLGTQPVQKILHSRGRTIDRSWSAVVVGWRSTIKTVGPALVSPHRCDRAAHEPARTTVQHSVRRYIGQGPRNGSEIALQFRA
jgi:hypothetical protein